MKIHLFGASASGVTTLGHVLAEKLNSTYYDSDQYFWLATEPPFTTKRNLEERNQLIRKALTANNNWIFGGSSVSWGQDVFPDFDLIVFLWLPPEIRLARLKQREFERYGSIIYTDKERSRQYQEFIEWASQYDLDPLESGFNGRSLKVHEDWLKNQKTRILRIEGDFTVEEKIQKIVDFL